MAPKVHVPMNFGVHLRSSPTHNTLKLNTSEGGEVLASSVILSFNSPVIDHMTTTLHMTSVDMLEFSEAAVQVFVDAAYSGTAEGINKEIFRDINKMANVFEVVWLMEKCSEYFTEVTNMIVTPSYSELLYLFEEACFVYENLNKKDYIELANDKIQELDWKEQFIDKYLENADRLSTKKLDMVIELAGSDVNFVVQTLVNQLTEMFKVQGPCTCLPLSCKYLLDNIDLSVCVRTEASGFYQLFELLKELPSENLHWTFDLMLKSTKKSACSDLTCRSTQTNRVARCNTVPNLYNNLEFNTNFDELLDWMYASDSVNSLLLAVEAVCTWHYYHFVNENKIIGFSENRLETELNVLAKRKDWLLLSPEMTAIPFCLYSKAGSWRRLSLTKICSSNVTPSYVVLDAIETCSNPYSVLSKETKITFHFKHHSVNSCNKRGNCGFILKTVPSEAALWKLRLCTEEEDYYDLDVHFHEEIRAENMHLFFLRNGKKFPLSWLCYIHSKFEMDRWAFRFATDEINRFCLTYHLS